MSRTHTIYHNRVGVDGEDIELEIEFSIASFGAPESPPSYFSGGEPAEGPEFDILDAKDELGNEVELTAEERVAIETAIAEQIDEYADDVEDF